MVPMGTNITLFYGFIGWLQDDLLAWPAGNLEGDNEKLGKDWSFNKRPYQGWDWTCKELKIVKIKVKMVFKNEFKDSKSNLKTFLRVQLGYDMI